MTGSPRDSQQALALSIAKAVQLGLPEKDSEEAIQASVRDALGIEARKNELLLAYLRCVLVGTIILASAINFLRPEWLGANVPPWWPAGVVLAVWFGMSLLLAIRLARGWYRPVLKRAVPAADAVAITIGFLLLDLNFARHGIPSPVGPFIAAAVACAFLVFSGAVRLSRSGARLATILGLCSWIAIWALSSIPPVAGVLTAGLIFAIGTLATRITRVVRRVIVDEVTRMRLVQLYERAQEAIDAREEVLRIVSHDLRNPLGTISMATDVMLEDSPSEADRIRYLHMIRRQGETMTHLVNDLLDAARIQAGRLSIEPRAVAVGELIRTSVEMMAPLAAERQIRLETYATDPSTSLAVDPYRIGQVFSNLIGNAIKFTPEGGRITVSAVGMGTKVRLSVADTGPGIPSEQLSQVFGRMWQARREDTRGIGLGLTIAQAIVEAHGEKIGVESRVGEGTEFWFTVPIAGATDSASAVLSDATAAD